jgi:alkylhydroperoxidase family enzyme
VHPDTTSPDAAFAAVLRGHPAVLDALNAVHAAAWAAVEPGLLLLCRARIAMLLGDEEEGSASALDAEIVEALPAWPSSPLFTDKERACLAFTEQFVIDVASMDDALVETLRAELGPEGLANFVNALLVVEQRQRLRLAWRRLFPEVVA